MPPTKILSLFLSFCLIFEQAGFAQSIDLSHYFVRNSGQNIPQSDKFRPLHLRYISYDSQANDFKLLLDKGDFFNQQTPKLPNSPNSPNSSTPKLEEATQELMKYFFIGLSLPNEKFWVNLRPDSPDNILDPELEKTDIGRIFLEADLQLKKDTASFTSPQTKEGSEYWDKLYKKAGELFGSENITIPTITRPWIVPNEIIIREAPDNAYIYKARLKVMLEEDYLNQKTEKPKNGKTEELRNQRTDWHSFSDPRLKELNQYSTQLIKETIIPKLTYAVNTAKRYAQLRQVYYSLILAQWFKQKYGSSGSARASGTRVPVNSYVDQIDSGNLANLTSSQPYDKQSYFQQYQKSFKDGEYNLQEPVYTPMGQSIRRYMSGGAGLGNCSPTDIIPTTKLALPQVDYSYILPAHIEVNPEVEDFFSQEIRESLAEIEDFNLDALKEILTNSHSFQDKIIAIRKLNAAMGNKRKKESISERFDNIVFMLRFFPGETGNKRKELMDMVEELLPALNNIVSNSQNALLRGEALLLINKFNGRVGLSLANIPKELFVTLEEIVSSPKNSQNLEREDILRFIKDYDKYIQSVFIDINNRDIRETISTAQNYLLSGKNIIIEIKYAYILSELFPLISQNVSRNEQISKAKGLVHIVDLLRFLILHDGMLRKESSKAALKALENTLKEYRAGKISNNKFPDLLKNISSEFLKYVFTDIVGFHSQTQINGVLNKIDAEKMSNLLGLFLRIDQGEIKEKLRSVLNKLIEYEGDAQRLNQWLVESAPWNAAVTTELITKVGYYPSLWHTAIIIKDVRVGAQNYAELFKNIKTHTNQIIEMAESLGIKIPEEILKNGLSNADDASRFINDLVKPRIGDNQDSELAPFESVLRKVLDLEKANRNKDNKTEFVTVEIEKDFIKDTYGGVGVPGCFDPWIGQHKEMPLVHALESNSLFLRIYLKGKMIANAVIVLTDKGPLIFKLYNSTNLSLDEAAFKAIKVLMRKMRKTVQNGSELSAIFFSESVAYKYAEPLGYKTKGVTFIKRESAFHSPYYDGNAKTEAVNTIFGGPGTEFLLLTYNMLRQIGKPDKIAQGITEDLEFKVMNPNESNLNSIVSAMIELQRTQYGSEDLLSEDEIREALVNTKAVNIIVKNKDDSMLGYIIGRPFENAQGDQDISLHYLDGDSAERVFYVDDILVHSEYRHHPYLLVSLLKRFKDALQLRDYAILFMHVNRENTDLINFLKRRGAEPLEIIPNENVMLLRMRLDADNRRQKPLVNGNNGMVSSVDDKGGIAFNALPIQTEFVASSALGALFGARAFRGDLDAEWARIQDIFNAGVRPSIQRLSEYTAAAVTSPLAEDKIDQVRVMLADILRREEEDEKIAPVSPVLKDLLIALESDKPASEFQFASVK